MSKTEYLEKKLNNLLTAISKDLILKDDAYSQFVGYTKAFAELGIITSDEAKQYRLRLAKVIY